MAGASWAQSNMSISTPMISGEVKVKDNWTPPTAPNYKEYRTGTTSSYAVDFNYSFRPKSFIKNKNILLNIGAGYFFQRFDVNRPFNYNSLIYIGFYTHHYSYLCFDANVGVTYKYTFMSEKYFMTYNLTYRVLKSFQQNYTPTYNTGTEGFFAQTNRHQIDFGKMLHLVVGMNRRLGNRFSIGGNVIAPLYTRWRNDGIFADDPTTTYKPKFSLGASLSLSYNLERQQSS